jgi:aminoglycoside phosphotransferase (APT) family kinase protein
VVRRPPLGHVLATAHDMAREYRVLSALATTPVPVPRTELLCEDTEVLGAPFYVMDFVEGLPYRTAEQLAAIGPERTRTLVHTLVDTLVTLHAVDPGAVGLADFGRPEGFLQRQLRRWADAVPLRRRPLKNQTIPCSSGSSPDILGPSGDTVEMDVCPTYRAGWKEGVWIVGVLSRWRDGGLS